LIDSDISRFTELVNKHSGIGGNLISYDNHVNEKRDRLYSSIGDRKIVYLDTNAWKCLSDFQRRKPTLTADMLDYSTEMFNEDTCDKFLFPITMSTIFELQSMNDPDTIATLASIIDKLSKNVCIIPDVDRIESEIRIFLSGEELLPRKLYFIRPFELMNIPIPDFPIPTDSLKLPYKKALYDLIEEKPVSTYLTDDMFRGDINEKWDNNDGIDEMNTGKAAYQSAINSIQEGRFIELSGIFRDRYRGPSGMKDVPPSKWLALQAMWHWHEHPSSNQLISARVMASIHSIMRLEKNRNFKKGDVADFSTATTVIPFCDALFTDARLVNIATDIKIEMSKFCDCKIIGFSGFANYLRENR